MPGTRPASGSGFIVIFGLLAGKRLDGWTAVFLATTVATSVTGFGFLKVPALKALAPKQTEAPFVVAQAGVLVLFVVLGSLAAIRFRAERGDTR